MKTKVLAFFSIIIAAAVMLWGTNAIFATPGIKENQNETAVTAYAGSRFSYQGYLIDNIGDPLDGTYNMTFRFWDQVVMGSQVGGDIMINNVDVDQGLFTVIIDVTDGFFDGSALWLQTRVGTEWLAPLKEVVPVPYALSLWPGAETHGEPPQGSAIFTAVNLGDGHGLTGRTESTVENFMSAGVYGHSVYSRTFGVLGESEFGIGVEGRLTNTENTNGAVVGYNTGGGNGVEGYSTNNYGVYAEGGLYRGRYPG
jgi:hypothetical protein